MHALSVLESEQGRSSSDSQKAKNAEAIAKLRNAVETDPEHPPDDVDLPDLRYAPKRRIARHIRLTHFPKIMAVHLSRSIYDASNLSQKKLGKSRVSRATSPGRLAQPEEIQALRCCDAQRQSSQWTLRILPEAECLSSLL